MSSLNLSGALADPEQPCRLLAGQPALAGLSLLRQYHAYNATMESLFGVVVDGSPQVF